MSAVTKKKLIPASYAASTTSSILLDVVSHRILGATDGELLGADAQPLAGADVDGDGDGEVIVGAYFADDTATDGGMVYVFAGTLTGTLTAADAAGTHTSAAPADFAGAGVAGVGDVNGDGVPDLLVGATGYAGTLGACTCSSMPPGDPSLRAAIPAGACFEEGHPLARCGGRGAFVEAPAAPVRLGPVLPSPRSAIRVMAARPASRRGTR
jgi:hypothetical protein